MTGDLRDALAAEFLGSAFLLAAVVGSGIMARSSRAVTARSRCSATRADRRDLVGADLDFRPGVGGAFQSGGNARVCLSPRVAACVAAIYLAVQVAGAIVGAWIAHLHV